MPAGVDGQVGPGDALLAAAGQVTSDGVAQGDQRLGERGGGRVPVSLGNGGDLDRAAEPAQGTVSVAVGVLAAPEVRQQPGKPPAVRAGCFPGVVDPGVAAHVGHGVDRAGPAQHLPSGVAHRPGHGLRDGDAAPVRLAAGQLRPAGRSIDDVGRAGVPRFQQQDPDAGVLGQPGCQYAPCCPAADDNEVVVLHCFPSPGRPGHRAVISSVISSSRPRRTEVTGSSGDRACPAAVIAARSSVTASPAWPTS